MSVTLNYNNLQNDLRLIYKNKKFKLLIIFNFLLMLLCFLFLKPYSGWGGGQKGPPTSFSRVTSRNVRTSFQNFLTFSFNLLPYWCKISGSYLVPLPNYWTWTKTTPQKKRFFWSNPYKIEIMITSVIEMLELPNFGHMTTSTV